MALWRHLSKLHFFSSHGAPSPSLCAYQESKATQNGAIKVRHLEGISTSEPSITSAGAHRGSQQGALLLVALPEQFTSVGVCLVIDGLFEDAAEVERQPAEREDHHQAEDCLGHLPALQEEGGQEKKLHLLSLESRWSTICTCSATALQLILVTQ